MIEIHKEPDDFSDVEPEKCVFCQESTRYWMENKHVPCCQSCSKIYNVEDAIDKQAWIQKYIFNNN